MFRHNLAAVGKAECPHLPELGQHEAAVRVDAFGVGQLEEPGVLGPPH